MFQNTQMKVAKYESANGVWGPLTFIQANQFFFQPTDSMEDETALYSVLLLVAIASASAIAVYVHRRRTGSTSPAASIPSSTSRTTVEPISKPPAEISAAKRKSVVLCAIYMLTTVRSVSARSSAKSAAQTTTKTAPAFVSSSSSALGVIADADQEVSRTR